MELPEKKDRYGAFLLYVDDWLSSTAIDLMNAAEERGYLRLLMHSWKCADCGLPDDDRTLAKLSKLGGGWYGKSGDVLRAQFSEREGRLFNDRLLRERIHQQEVRLSRSNAGRTAAVYRWNASRIPDAQQKHASPNPSPNLIDKHKERAPWTEEISAGDRAYLDDYRAKFYETYGVEATPEECPFRILSVEREDDAPLMYLSIEYAGWVLGTMQFRKPPTWGMVHVVPQVEVDRRNAPFRHLYPNPSDAA